MRVLFAQALAAQDQDDTLKTRFTKVMKQLTENEATITAELLAGQGQSVDIGGYYHPDPSRTKLAMRPSETFNAIIDAL